MFLFYLNFKFYFLIKTCVVFEKLVISEFFLLFPLYKIQYSRNTFYMFIAWEIFIKIDFFASIKAKYVLIRLIIYENQNFIIINYIQRIMMNVDWYFFSKGINSYSLNLKCKLCIKIYINYIYKIKKLSKI